VTKPSKKCWEKEKGDMEKNLLYAYKPARYEICHGFAQKTSWALTAAEGVIGEILYRQCALFLS